MDGGQFIVVLLGGIAGLILIKFAATWFVRLLAKRPALETRASSIVAWGALFARLIKVSQIGSWCETCFHYSCL